MRNSPLPILSNPKGTVMEAVFYVQDPDARKSDDTATAGGAAIPLEKPPLEKPSRANPAAGTPGAGTQKAGNQGMGDRAASNEPGPVSPVVGYETDRYRLVQPFTTKL